MSDGVLPLGPGQLALAGALILLNAAASVALQLGLERRLLLGAVRAFVQLLLLGLVLQWVFALQGPTVVLGLMVAMAVLAGVEAARRTTHRVAGLHALSMAVMLVSSFTVTFYAVLFIVDVQPWWRPQYIVPVLGMVLGNTLNGISLGLETTLAGFATERERVEMLLAHGATRAEASRDVVRRAVSTGLIPILNAMAAAGVVSIPGMMTGQILAGQDPAGAARYQIMILFVIAGGVALGTVGIVLGATRLVFDDRDRLRSDRIRSVGSR